MNSSNMRSAVGAGPGKLRSTAGLAASGLILASLAALVGATPAQAEGGGYVAGFHFDSGRDIAVGPDGSAYITGSTYEDEGFDTTPGASDETHNGAEDAFLVRIDPTGRVVYATLIGGTWHDRGTSITVDRHGAAYLSGETEGRDFPTTPGALDNSYWPRGWDNHLTGFLAKISPDGSTVEYSTRVPGSVRLSNVAVDSDGAAHIVGEGYPDLPVTTTALGPAPTDSTEGFVATIDPTGSRMLHTAFLGGSGNDHAGDVHVTADGATYVSGSTDSPDFPTTPDAYDRTFNGGSSDAFVVKIAPSGDQFLWSTFIGSSGKDPGAAMAVRRDGGVVLSGISTSNFPTTADALYPDNPWPMGWDWRMVYDGPSWVARLDPTGSQLLFSTFFPATLFRPTLDEAGNIHFTGYDPLAAFPTTQGPDSGDDVAVTLDAEGRLLDSFHLAVDPSLDWFRSVTDGAGSYYLLGWRNRRPGPGTDEEQGSVDASNDPEGPRNYLARYATCTISGTPGPDQLVGTAGPDVICAGAGDDVVDSRGGPDIIRLGSGHDRAIAGAGIDVVTGGDGRDRLSGSGRRDLLQGGPGADILRGNSGSDTLQGGRGSDRLYGQGGVDDVHGGPHRDLVAGAKGRDELTGGRGPDELTGGLGRDRLDGGRAADNCRGGAGVDKRIRCDP